jgi:hypothetical protein
VNAVKLLMMHCIVGVGLGLVLAVATPAVAGDVTEVSGSVGYVSKDVVEVGGRRGLITNATSIVSEGHPISISSVQVGMQAELEIDPAGEALELRVKGAVE